ncbi:MAG: hypothetical protein E6Q97_32900 [Desulfurellales bacterium]|nr:MAG: hypothetical protein E6Q97_32900 [Desulfurellales bacterium]
MNELNLETLSSWKAMNPRWWLVSPLMTEEIDWIEASGKERNEFGKRKGWRSRTKDTDDRWNVMGIAGEWAASLVLNLKIGKITGSVEELNQGDIGGFCEVRTSIGKLKWQWDLGGFESVVKRKLGRPWVHCIGALYPGSMIVTGWAWGWEILRSGKTRHVDFKPSDPIRFLEQDQLRDIKTLFDEECWRKASETRLF